MEALTTLRFIEECKDLIKLRIKLIEDQKKLKNRIASARIFFNGIKPSDDCVSDIKRGIGTLNKIMDDIIEVDNKIKDIDTTLISILESSICGDVRIVTKSDTNEAGDNVQPTKIRITCDGRELDEAVITPADLWLLKQIKQVIGVKGVEVIHNE